MRQPARLCGAVLLSALAGCVPSSLLSRAEKPAQAPQKTSASPPPLAQSSCSAGEERFATAAEVQRRAVLDSGLANALERQGESSSSCGCSLCRSKGASDDLSRTLRKHAADEVRNQEASRALQVYYHYAESRGQMVYLLEGRKVVEEVIRQGDELDKKGLETPAEMPAMRHQRSKLTADSLELALTGDQLQEQLRQVIDCCDCRITTQDTFQVDPTCVDEESAVAVGLANRPDLALLRTAYEKASPRTLPALQTMLSATNGLLQSSAHVCLPVLNCLCLLCPKVADAKVDDTKQQIQALLADRERKAVAEIRSAVKEVNARVKIAALAREREDMARKVVEEWEEKERKGLKVREELPRARRDLAKARSDTLHEVIAWEIARVKLRQSQGLLVREVQPGQNGQGGCSQPGSDAARASP